MSLIPFELRPGYQSEWDPDYYTKDPAGMYSYLRWALGAQGKVSPTAEERAAEITVKFPEPALPPEILPDDANAETIIKLKVLNSAGQTYFTKQPVMEFRIKRTVQELPTYVIIDAVGMIKLSKLSDLGFWRTFQREIKEQVNDPHVQLFLSLGLSKWIGMDYSTPSVTSPLGKIGRFFSRIYDPVKDTIDPWIDKVDGFFSQITDPVTKTAGPWVKKVGLGIDKLIDPVTGTWSGWVTNINNRICEFEKNIEPNLVNFGENIYTSACTFVDTFNKALKLYNQSLNDYIAMQQRVATAINRPLEALNENFTVPLKKDQADLDLRLAKVANYLSLLGINEGQRARIYADAKVKQVTDPLFEAEAATARFAQQVQTNLTNFRENEFFRVQGLANRANSIIETVKEIIKGEEVERLRMFREPFSETLKAYPATTLASLDKGRDAYIPDMIVFPAPEEHMFPELKKWIERYDASCGKMFVDDENIPLAPVVQNGVLKTKMKDYDGEVLSAVGTLNKTSYDSTDDLVVLGHLWNAAVDKGIIVDFAVPSEPQEIPFLLKMRYYAGYPGLWVGWILQDIWDDFGSLHHFYYDPPDEENYNLAALEEDFWDSYNKFLIYLGELKAEGAQFGP